MKAVSRLLIFLLAAVTMVACDALDSLTEPEFIIPPTIPAREVIPAGPTQTRRPAPTPFPTEELARPLSESPVPVPTAVELSEEKQAELGLASILAAQRAGLAVEALRATITDENLSSGERSTLLLEFVRPNSYRMVTEELELIVAAGQTFLMDKTANWLVSPGEQIERFGALFDPFTDEQTVEERINTLSENVQELQLQGEEELNGQPTQIFTFVEETVDGETPVRTSVWIGVEDGLLYRQVITFSSNGENFQVTTVFDYGDSIQVEAPLP